LGPSKRGKNSGKNKLEWGKKFFGSKKGPEKLRKPPSSKALKEG